MGENAEIFKRLNDVETELARLSERASGELFRNTGTGAFLYGPDI